MMEGNFLTPKQIVAELDKYIIGQNDAKRNVAIALRNRWRRMSVKSEMRDEIIPNNILMIGATGVGKTEIARRLAKIADAPFMAIWLFDRFGWKRGRGGPIRGQNRLRMKYDGRQQKKC